MEAAAKFPLQPRGAAAERVALLGQHHGLNLRDLTAVPRFGIKGPGAADWFVAVGIELPVVNRHASHRGLRILRLGRNDILCLAQDGSAGELAQLQADWDRAAAPKGYSSWRDEGWAWFHLDGPNNGAVMATLCALDLRAHRFAAEEIAQTRFAHVDAVLLRAGEGFDVLFDITLTAYVIAAIHEAGETVHTGRQP